MASTENVNGLADLAANIDALTQRLSAALPEIVMQGALIVEAEIRQRAPVASGALVSSLDAKSARRQASASATVQIERSGPDGTEHYAIFDEFGTSHQPAQPYFRPGVEAARAPVGVLMTQDILQVIGA